MARVTIQGRVPEKAARYKVKAAIGIDGTSGEGKTGLALVLAHALAGNEWDKIMVTDTENQSSLLYVGKKLHTGNVVEPFQVMHLTKADGYSPFNYEYCREQAVQAGCKVNIMDSYTHAWFRQGGILDEVNRLQNAANSKYNKYTAWGDKDVADAKNLLFELVRDNRIHVISTIRVKESYVMVTNDAGAIVKVQSVGEQQMQSDGLQYEFDLLLRMIRPGADDGTPPRVLCTKSRYDLFVKDTEYDITPELVNALAAYLENGADPAVLEERLRDELIQGLNARITANGQLFALFRNNYKDRRLSEMSLAELRKLNSECLEIESTR